MLNGVARRLAPMAVLYSGRIGVAALGLVVLPWLNRVMPAREFGLAATVLSLQGLAVVLDLGLSVSISRELPVLADPHDRRVVLQRSERALLTLYAVTTLIAAGLATSGVIPVPVPTALLICLSLLVIVWQNLIVVAFISRQRFQISTISQFTSLLLRHGISLVLVIVYAGTLQMFIIGQAVGGAIVLAASRSIFFRQHRSEGRPPMGRMLSSATNVSMMIYTIAGACALQLDKVLLSAIASPVYTGPYFLASTLSLVPITFLASPVSQFVQPKLIASLADHRDEDARRWITRLTLAVVGFAVIPGIGLVLAAPWIIPLWLHGSPQQATVIRYVTLLMPGAAMGSLGLIPAIVLIARRDYRAMATISCVLATAVLAAAAVFAARDVIGGVCIAYAAYHTLAAAALWWRAWQIEPSFGNPFAIRARIANGGARKNGRRPRLNLNNWWNDVSR